MRVTREIGRTNGRMQGLRRGLAAAMLLAGLSLALGGCSISMSDMPVLGGTDKPEKTATESFPAVNDLPVNRDEAVLAPAERSKIEQELIAARERQANSNASASANAGSASKANSAK